MNNSEVCFTFLHNRQRQSARGSNLYWKTNPNNSRTLFSYGSHWCVAHKTGATVCVNVDRRSVTTNRHQSLLLRALRGQPEIRVAWFSQAIIRWGLGLLGNWYRVFGNDPSSLRVLDSAPDEYRSGSFWVRANEPNGPRFANPDESAGADDLPSTIAGGSLSVYYTGETTDSGAYRKMGWSYHRAGATVYQCGRERFLFSADEGQYFCVLLDSRRVDTVDDAIADLRPRVVQEYVRRFDKVPVRQGEFFFLPIQDYLTMYSGDFYLSRFPGLVQGSSAQQQRALRKINGAEDALVERQAIPNVDSRATRHVAGRACIHPRVLGALSVRDGEPVALVSGTVRHDSRRGRGRAEHAPVKLGDIWHVVFRNTAREAFSITQFGGMGWD